MCVFLCVSLCLCVLICLSLRDLWEIDDDLTLRPLFSKSLFFPLCFCEWICVSLRDLQEIDAAGLYLYSQKVFSFFSF